VHRRIGLQGTNKASLDAKSHHHSCRHMSLYCRKCEQNLGIIPTLSQSDKSTCLRSESPVKIAPAHSVTARIRTRSSGKSQYYENHGVGAPNIPSHVPTKEFPPILSHPRPSKSSSTPFRMWSTKPTYGSLALPLFRQYRPIMARTAL